MLFFKEILTKIQILTSKQHKKKQRKEGELV